MSAVAMSAIEIERHRALSRLLGQDPLPTGQSTSARRNTLPAFDEFDEFDDADADLALSLAIDEVRVADVIDQDRALAERLYEEENGSVPDIPL